MLQRLRALQDASATARPTQLLPHLYVSGAVEANSLHLLRHLGITHLLNATEDLLQPDADAGFRYPHLPLLQRLRCVCARVSFISTFLMGHTAQYVSNG